MDPKAALKPFTLDTLSTYACHHLESACPSLFQDYTILNNINGETAIEPLTDFTIFPKLPQEMQNEIWKHFSKLEPRTVTVDWAQHCILAPKDGNQMPALYQINKDTRRDTLKRYGYVMLKHPITDQKVLFHPELDLLYITESTAFVWAPFMAIPRSLMTSLGVCGALSRIRSIALPMRITNLTLYMEAFGLCANLELVLGVWKYKQTTDGGTVAAFCFEDAEIACTEYNMSLDIDEREFQSMMVRDGGVTPFWMEVNRTQLFDESEKVSNEDYDGDSEGKSDDSSDNGDL